MSDLDIHPLEIGLRAYYPPVLLDNRRYIALVEALCEVYPAQRRETDTFEFTLSAAQALKVTPQMVSVNEIFQEDFRTTTRHVFHVLGRTLDILQAERIESFDHAVTARFAPPGARARGAFDEYAGDVYVEKSFLQAVDFKALQDGGPKPMPGVNWIFEMGEKNVSLKIEPFGEDRNFVFVELSIQHPQGNFSLGDLRASVEGDMRYLLQEVVRFLGQNVRPGR